MSLCGFRIVPTIFSSTSNSSRPHVCIHARGLRTLRGSVVAVALPTGTTHTTSSPSLPSRQSPRIGHRRDDGPAEERNARDSTRSFGSGNGDADSARGESSSPDGGQLPLLVYEGPFASLTLKLKRISLTSAAIGLVGLPALSLFGGTASSVPASGQLAVVVTAGVAAVGSTALLGYCFSPYVHTLERLLPPPPLPHSAEDGAGDHPAGEEGGGAGGIGDQRKNCTTLARIVTRDIVARRVVTVFDPATDVSTPPNGITRPFCNFVVRGTPMYVHPELLHDDELRAQLFGEDPQLANAEARNKTKSDDDEFL